MEPANTNSITVAALIQAPAEKVWERFTGAEHIKNWNHASPEWHCPKAENDLRAGGKFVFTMAAKDGSFSFDFPGTYTEVTPNKHIAYTLDDGRKVTIDFAEEGTNATRITQTFDPEKMNARELQQQGWQAILNNFKAYAEGN